MKKKYEVKFLIEMEGKNKRECDKRINNFADDMSEECDGSHVYGYTIIPKHFKNP